MTTFCKLFENRLKNTVNLKVLFASSTLVVFQLRTTTSSKLPILFYSNSSEISLSQLKVAQVVFSHSPLLAFVPLVMTTTLIRFAVRKINLELEKSNLSFSTKKAVQSKRATKMQLF